MEQIVEVAAPFFEDFRIGQTFDAPAVTLTTGHAALYQAMTGDRLRLPLDAWSSARVTGCGEPLAHPMLTINMAIGQTTWASQRVKANLFYRGLELRRPVHIGDTLHTTSTVIGLKQNRSQAGRAATGIVALEMTTRNQDGAEVLHFWRCPMILCRSNDAITGHADDLDRIGQSATAVELSTRFPSNWRVAEVVTNWSGLKHQDLRVGQRFRVEARDSVTLAPELVRLTLNMAMAHTDAAFSYLSERLVYGGHTISIAFAQVTRALPNLLTLAAWESCDHLAPVLEGDRLRSEFSIDSITPTQYGALLGLRVQTYAARGTPETETRALDWRFYAWSC
jgi:acyl dehydratase